jgi:hypothetical protein
MSDSTGTLPATKRSAITVLIVTNLCFLAALLSECYSLPNAKAQPGGRGGEYLCVTAKPANQAYDVLYIVDPAAHRLHAFYPSLPPQKQLTEVEPRDLKKDFGK